jgi:competence protein ComEC
LIDDGPGPPEADAGEKLVLPALRRLGVDSVSAIFLSHPDEGHVGGTPAVLKEYPTARIVMSDEFRTDPAMVGHLAQWKVPAERVCWLPLRDRFVDGKFVATIVCPDMRAGDEANNGSMFVRVSCGGASAMFSGDAPRSVEDAMESCGSWTSEILKVGHHGSRTATDPSWLQAVHPRFAVISVGRNNRYGHPNAEVVDELREDHVKTYRTDQDGDVVFTFNGQTFLPESG